jgi:hypothetical protein
MRGMILLCCWHIDHLKQVRSFLNHFPKQQRLSAMAHS